MTKEFIPTLTAEEMRPRSEEEFTLNKKGNVKAFLSGRRGKEIFNSILRPFNQNKEKAEMNMNQSVDTKEVSSMSKATGAVLAGIKDGANRLWKFVRRHAEKSMFGLTALTIGGLITNGLGAALLVGTSLYAAVAVAAALIKTRKEKEAARKEAVMEALGDSLLYGTVGAMAAYCLAALLVSLLANAFVYSYIGYAYMSYFIVA